MQPRWEGKGGVATCYCYNCPSLWVHYVPKMVRLRKEKASRLSGITWEGGASHLAFSHTVTAYRWKLDSQLCYCHWMGIGREKRKVRGP